MSEQQPIDRLNYVGDLTPLVASLCKAYGVGELVSFKPIEMGYEDCNVIIQTSDGKFVAKMFAKARSADEITRYAAIMERVLEAGVCHPELLKTTTHEFVYDHDKVSLVLMRFVDGKTFLQLDRAPNEADRDVVIKQAAMINSIDYKPKYLYDSWAILNIEDMYKRVEQYIKAEDLELVDRVLEEFKAIPINELPHCFVHGDITKANVIKSEDGIYIVDFSVANWYPRIQELSVIIANLLHDLNGISLKEKCEIVADEYSKHIHLTESERKHLPAYALTGMAMEFLGSHQEKYINGIDNDETTYWLNLGREGLRSALIKE